MKETKNMSIAELRAAKAAIAQKMAVLNESMDPLEEEMQKRLEEERLTEAYERVIGQPLSPEMRATIIKAVAAEAAAGGGKEPG